MPLSLPAVLIFWSLSKPLVLVPSRVWNDSSVQVASFWQLHKELFEQQGCQGLLLRDVGLVLQILKRCDGESHYTSVESPRPTFGPAQYWKKACPDSLGCI